jgi:DNA-directed RNA polymerase II subunit RPB1
MTRGVPRLKELLTATQNPRATSLTIALRPDLRTSKEEARRLAQELEFTMLKDLVTTSRIYYDPRDSATLIAEDRDWLSFFAAFEQSDKPADDETPTNPWIIRFELNREAMFNKNITMDDINFVLNRGNTDGMRMTYTDHNAGQMVMRIRLPGRDTPAPLDDLAYVKQKQTQLLTMTLVRGLPGLRAVSFRKLTGDDEICERNPAADGKYEPVQQFVLDTFGTNFVDTMIHPDVDGLRVISNHVHDIYETLGIEAARAILFKEIFSLFEQAAPVNYRHVSLLVDAMCNRGRMMSADRIGVNRKQKIGPLAKASFEQTEDIMIRAAMFGEMDAVTGVAANIMTGQPIRGGTSFTQVLLDEAAFQELMKTAPAPRRSLERAPALVQAEIDRMLDTKQAPGCRTEDLRIPAALPPVEPGVATDTELPDLDIELVDE